METQNKNEDLIPELAYFAWEVAKSHIPKQEMMLGERPGFRTTMHVSTAIRKAAEQGGMGKIVKHDVDQVRALLKSHGNVVCIERPTHKGDKSVLFVAKEWSDTALPKGNAPSEHGAVGRQIGDAIDYRSKKLRPEDVREGEAAPVTVRKVRTVTQAFSEERWWAVCVLANNKGGKIGNKSGRSAREIAKVLGKDDNSFVEMMGRAISKLDEDGYIKRKTKAKLVFEVQLTPKGWDAYHHPGKVLSAVDGLRHFLSRIPVFHPSASLYGIKELSENADLNWSAGTVRGALNELVDNKEIEVEWNAEDSPYFTEIRWIGDEFDVYRIPGGVYRPPAPEPEQMEIPSREENDVATTTNPLEEIRGLCSEILRLTDSEIDQKPDPTIEQIRTIIDKASNFELDTAKALREISELVKE